MVLGTSREFVARSRATRDWNLVFHLPNFAFVLVLVLNKPALGVVLVVDPLQHDPFHPKAKGDVGVGLVANGGHMPA